MSAALPAAKQPRKKSKRQSREPAEDYSPIGDDNAPPVHGATKRKRPDPVAQAESPTSSVGLALRLSRGLDKLEQGERVNRAIVAKTLTEDRKVAGGPTFETHVEMIDMFIRSWQTFVRPGAARSPLWRVFLNNRVPLREQAERVLTVQAAELSPQESAERTAMAQRANDEFEAEVLAAEQAEKEDQ